MRESDGLTIEDLQDRRRKIGPARGLASHPSYDDCIWTYKIPHNITTKLKGASRSIAG